MKSICRQKMFLPQNSMTCHYLWWPIYPESWILKFLTFKTTRYNDMMFVEYTCHRVDILLWIRIRIVIGIKRLIVKKSFFCCSVDSIRFSWFTKNLTSEIFRLASFLEYCKSKGRTYTFHECRSTIDELPMDK